MNPLDVLADVIGATLGRLAEALLQAGRNVQWRNAARLRPVRPTWRRLWTRVGGLR